MTTRILIADDHKIISESLVPILNTQQGIKVIGVVTNGREAVEKTLQQKPDIVIMDISMPVLNGIEATREIIAKQPDARIIILSMHDDRRYIIGALEAGASGYLTKGCSLKELLAAIAAVKEHKKYFSPDIHSILNSGVYGSETSPASSSSLTVREREVLQQLAEGQSIKEIAFLLNLSIKTVHTHRASIMNKLKIKNTASLIKYAIQEGITSVNS